MEQFAYQKIGRTSSLTRKTFAGRLQGKGLDILASSIKPRFCQVRQIRRAEIRG